MYTLLSYLVVHYWLLNGSANLEDATTSSWFPWLRNSLEFWPLLTTTRSVMFIGNATKKQTLSLKKVCRWLLGHGWLGKTRLAKNFSVRTGLFWILRATRMLLFKFGTIWVVIDGSQGGGCLLFFFYSIMSWKSSMRGYSPFPSFTFLFFQQALVSLRRIEATTWCYFQQTFVSQMGHFFLCISVYYDSYRGCFLILYLTKT